MTPTMLFKTSVTDLQIFYLFTHLFPEFVSLIQWLLLMCSRFFSISKKIGNLVTKFELISI